MLCSWLKFWYLTAAKVKITEFGMQYPSFSQIASKVSQEDTGSTWRLLSS